MATNRQIYDHATRMALEQDLKFLQLDRQRKREGLKVYRPMTPEQEQVHRCKTMEMIVFGGNRSGKSFSTAAEIASAALGVPIIGMDGNPLPMKYPKRPLVIWVIGKDLKHVGQTIHRLLFQRGCGAGGDFRVIWNEAKQDYDIFNPNLPEHAGKEDLSELAEPFIPERFVKEGSWDWEKKSGEEFKAVTLTNGTKMFAYASSGNMKTGDAVDLIWIDEDIKFAEYLHDWRMRLATRGGRLIWSSKPYMVNNALREMCRKAEKQAEDFEKTGAEPVVTQIRLKMSQNKFIREDVKEKLFRDVPDSVRRERDEGSWEDEDVLMYPEFAVARHGCPNEQVEHDWLDEILKEKGELPKDWTRFMALDPGHGINAAVFLCVPPPSMFGEGREQHHVIVERELQLKNAAAETVAYACKEQMRGLTYHAFLIDPHAGKQTTLGHYQTVMQQYATAFEKVGVKCLLTGSAFAFAEGDPEVRRPAVRQMLMVRPDGTTKLRILNYWCPKLVKELTEFRRSATGAHRDSPNKNDVHDIVDALEYGLCNHLLRYYEPPQKKPTDQPNHAQRILDAIAGRGKQSTGVFLGPGSRVA